MPILLIILGVLLIVFNLRAAKKEKQSFQNALNKEEFDITEVEILVGELRKDFSESLLDLQKEIVELKENISKHPIENSEMEYIKKEEDLKYNDNEERAVLLQKNLKQSSSYDENNIEDKISEKSLKNENNEDREEKIIKEEPEDDYANEKVVSVKKLLDKGIPIENICEEFNMGKGEVLLIRELYKN